jgi:hypothetical protein
MDEGMTIDESDVHSAKAEASMHESRQPDSKVTAERDLHP